jgi:molecular chaperone GrpE
MSEIEQALSEPKKAGSPGAQAPGEAEQRKGAEGAQPPAEQRKGAEGAQPPAEQRKGAGDGQPPAAQPAAEHTAGTGDAAAEVEGDLDELIRTAAERDEYLALAQRTQADFDNYRKRVARDSASAQERGVAALAKELLPALDNLDRALAGANANAEVEEDKLLAGVRLVRSELGAALSRMGIESFTPLGEPFDPSLHEAVATVERPANGPSGTVVEVYQPGYRLGTSVIRPARVVVSK